ncbi:FANTASTIC FOUR 3 [Spatholobus suberectus]|nr:FANTASTIC FOUR 3 [Spatholobus suberectus]
MAAIVCHTAYLESQLVESRIHRLMLQSPKPLPPPQQPIDLPFKSCFLESNTTVPNQGWSSIQALSSAPKESKSSYAHPQQRQSSVRLSPKSLELCTENLGNETGSDIIESGIELLSSSGCGEPYSGTRVQNRKAREARNFPPPLTTIRGSESIRVRPHREGGRLVLEVTKVPSCFQAERSPGRLRLCFWTEMQHHDDDDDDDIEEEFQSERNGQRQEGVEDNEDEIEEKEEGGVDAENGRGLEHQHTNGRNSSSVVRVENKNERPSSTSRCNARKVTMKTTICYCVLGATSQTQIITST